MTVVLRLVTVTEEQRFQWACEDGFEGTIEEWREVKDNLKKIAPSSTPLDADDNITF